MFKRDLVDYSLYLVTDRVLVGSKDFYYSIELALQGGVTMLQLREKAVSTLDFYEIALKVKEIAKEYSVPFLINDRLDIALAVDADGLHIGQEDMPLTVARKILGPDKLIGVSTFTVEESLLAVKEGADYLGVGAIFPTGSKADAHTVSLTALAQIKEAVNIPVVAIGGINEQNAERAMAAGIDGVSVISAILAQADVQEAAKNLQKIICSSKRK
ncbi:MAG: thiamine phosphate synthase [Pelosinus sp.]|nr:thiamine phosphate synthase [Pelosinus sp.]